jgi:hypothetical protein
MLYKGSGLVEVWECRCLGQAKWAANLNAASLRAGAHVRTRSSHVSRYWWRRKAVVEDLPSVGFEEHSARFVREVKRSPGATNRRGE